ncbi:MAG: PLP-dependent transferase, partial [Verrucomicrobiota bacterium]|nr:PLP-dependent transferase [Verrucomicrobiota bacterium]
MSVFAPIPLGQCIPANRPHAVSCSLPTMRAVIGYEEKDPAVLGKIMSGYPRFVVHPFARQLSQLVVRKHGLNGTTLWLTSSAGMAGELARRLRSPEVLPFAADWLHGVIHPTDARELAARAKLFLQNVGGFLSSREAEDHLVRIGTLAGAVPEAYFGGDAAAEVKRQLRPAFPSVADSDFFLASNGMNAVYAAFRALSEEQAAQGRTIWVQLGWLYLDTISILKKFTSAPNDYVYMRDVFDRAGLERLFAENGPRIAGIITEVPTNPLMQTPDVPWLADLARRHGAALIMDPSLVSAFNVNLLPHADVVTTSLTKYTASEGDVIAGLAVVNASSPHAAALRKKLPRLLEPVYPRDLARLAAQIGQTQDVLRQIQA